MASRDYILCKSCSCKLVYDGYDNIRESLDNTYGTMDLICPKCLAEIENKMQAAQAAQQPELERLTQRIAELEHQIKEIEENLDIEREEVRSLESAIASHKDRGLKHRQQIAELEKDCDIISGEYLALRIKHFDLQEYAAIGKFLIENATEWRRSHDGTGYAIMGLRLPYDADLSSVGMRRYSVEQVMKAAKGAAE